MTFYRARPRRSGSCRPRRTAAAAQANRAGRQLPARLHDERIILRSASGRAGRCAQAAEWDVSVGLAGVGLVLSAQRQRALAHQR
jgi:hypothetical protein